MPLAAGMRLGPYEVLGLIGSGGMGEVYKARDTRLGRTVAIKVLPPGAAADPERRRRFEQEARAVAALNHPHICTLHDIGREGDTDFLVMELVAGETLAARLTKGPLPRAQAIELAAQMAQALARAHGEGIVHRDLKPGNVMLTESGVKLLDFGLAKLTPASTPAADLSSLATEGAPVTGQGTIVGTLAYMAPEQLEGKDVDARTDLFAFGAVFYEMLTGRRAFEGSTQASLISAIMSADPPSLTTFEPLTPPALDRVVRKCLAKDPRARWQSATDLADDLKWISTGPGSAAPGVMALPSHRRAWPWVAAAGVLMVVGAVSGWWWVARSRAAPPAALEVKHTQVTFNGETMEAALSPDGRTLAYIVDRDNESVRQVMVRDLSGGQALSIWEGGSPSFISLRWSLDGSHVVILGSQKGETTRALRLVPRLGGPGRRIPGSYGPYLANSPDGMRWASAYQAASGGVTIAGPDGVPQAKIELPTSRWLVGLDWSPVTNRLAVVTGEQDSTWAAWTFLPDGTDRRRVHGGEKLRVTACWSDSDDALYLLRDTGEASDLLRLSTPGTGPSPPEVLLSGLPASQMCQVSSGGRRLLHDRQSWEANLFRVALEPHGAPPIALTHGTWSLTMPHVSPDGRWFSATRGPEIVMISIDGGEPVVMTSGSDGSWSPDGRRLAFVDNRGHGDRVWVADADGQQASEVPGSAGVVNWRVTWLSDQQLTWPTNEARDFRIHDLASGRDDWLLKDGAGGTVSDPCLSPKGDFFAVKWVREKAGLWLISWPSRDARFVAPDLAPFGWSADGTWIYAQNPKTSEVVRVSAQTGKIDSLARLSGWLGASACTLMPDRQSAVCSPAVVKSDIWMIENFDPHVPPAKR